MSLDSNLLSRQVFNDVKVLIIEGTLQRIQPDLFKGFMQLQKITLNLYNFEEFVHYGLNWLDSIDSFSEITLDSFESELFQEYWFPEADFCYFKNIYDNQKIKFKIVGFKSDKALTCTLAWAFKNLVSNRPLVQSFDSDSFKQYFAECDFNAKLNSCSNFSKVSNFSILSSINSVNDIKYLVYSIKYAIFMVVLPTVGIIGIVLNVLTFYVIISRKNFHSFRTTVFSFISAIAVFNSIIISVSLTKLMNECITYNGIFCSTIRENTQVQIFYIIQVFMIRFFKCCANLTLILFTLTRYKKVQNQNDNIIVKPFKAYKKFALVFVFALMFSFEAILQYKINNNDWNYYGKYPIEKNLFDLDYDSKNEGLVYIILVLVSEFLNSFFVHLINFCIDIFLILKFKDMKKKFKILFIDSNTPYLNKLKRKEFNLLKIVIVTGVLNFLFRLPELFGSIFKYLKYFLALDSFTYKKTDPIYLYVNLCVHMDICDELHEIAEILYLFSTILDFFVFYCYNKSFRVAFKGIFKF